MARIMINIHNSVKNNAQELASLLRISPASEEEAKDIEEKAIALERKMFEEKELIKDINAEKEIESERLAPYREPVDPIYLIDPDKPVMEELQRVSVKLKELQDEAKKVKGEVKESDQKLNMALDGNFTEAEQEITIRGATHIQEATYANAMAIAAGYDNSDFHRDIAVANKVINDPKIISTMKIPYTPAKIYQCAFDYQKGESMAVRDAAQFIQLAKKYMQLPCNTTGRFAIHTSEFYEMCDQLREGEKTDREMEFELIERIKQTFANGLPCPVRQYSYETAQRADAIRLEARDA